MEIVHAQTVLSQQDLDALKEETGENTTKACLQEAVEHYLNCPYTDEDTSELENRLKELKTK